VSEFRNASPQRLRVADGESLQIAMSHAFPQPP